MYALLLTLHALAAILWIGGVFYAYMVLRPSVSILEAPKRVQLWDQVFTRFFRWIWLFIALILLSGYTMLFTHFGGFAQSPPFLHAMQLAGWIMILLFVWLAHGPYRALHRAVAAQNWPEAGQTIPRIRRLVATILVVGLITAIIGVSGPYWA